MSVDFSKAFDSIHKEEMEKILRTNGLTKDNVTNIMMLYISTKAMVHSSNGVSDVFVIMAGVLEKDTLSVFLFTNCFR